MNQTSNAIVAHFRVGALLLCGTLAAPSGLADDSPRTTPFAEAENVNASLSVAVPDMDAAVLSAALTSVRCAHAAGELSSEAPTVVAIIDYSRPSTEERLWVIDLSSHQVLFREHVAHGQGTGGLVATAFSNQPDSHQTSLGLFKTAETYHGKHGYSLRLDGLEAGINDRARARAIVIHGASYATEGFIEKHGWLGRSWGCPAVDKAVSAELIDAIKGGAPVFAYYPDADWQAASPFLSCGAEG
ncbi:MAG: murein L,D-transpeptidase catalytic domain family protein [Proteobacteria bacterium]|nr:murein L,D-transpeptidase catalytic domain family protein [Pseudomonadota bacterium]